MTIDDFLKQLQVSPETIEFDQAISLVKEHFSYTPTKFYNGPSLVNEAGTNEGSCKLFALAKELNLDEARTLACFGKYYREDVLQNPDGDDHQNIRTFMQFGHAGITFEHSALKKK